MFLKFLVLCLSIQAISCAVDYCNPALCQGGTNIACNNTGLFNATACVSPYLVPLSQVDKNNFVDLHNYLRNLFSHGDVPGFKPSIRMATFSWNDELSQIAALNVKRCAFAHDTCRGTPNFLYAGQNIFLATVPGTLPPDVNGTITQSVYSWASEYQYTTQANLDNYTQSNGVGGEMIGHFLPLVLDRNTHVGCAYATFRGTHPTKGLCTFNYIVCNYASTAFPNRSVYKKGPVPASGCLSGKNPKYTSLCSINEKIDPNILL